MLLFGLVMLFNSFYVKGSLCSAFDVVYVKFSCQNPTELWERGLYDLL